uniref:Hop2 n=1 Tax=Brachionus calyciflorus TaxID=104777 RepID=M4SHW0_9BILA|nr:Hop2 [Brachionus calyciflorus]
MSNNFKNFLLFSLEVLVKLNYFLKIGKNKNETIVLDYLVEQNRPFSAQDITNNLDGKLGKTVITNALEKLAADNRIIEKVYGKQKVYMALQKIDTVNIKGQLRDLDEKIITSGAELNRIKQDNLKIESQLKSYGDKIPIKELESRISDVNSEIQDLEKRIKLLKSSNLDKEIEKYAKQWRKLKRIGKEMMDSILDNCNVKKKDLIVLFK